MKCHGAQSFDAPHCPRFCLRGSWSQLSPSLAHILSPSASLPRDGRCCLVGIESVNESIRAYMLDGQEAKCVQTRTKQIDEISI